MQARPWLAPPVELDAPALEVLSDLSQVKAVMTAPSATLSQAEQTMVLQGVRMLFVLSDAPAVEGLITSTDVRGDHAIRVVQERHLHLDELLVSDVTTPLAALESVDFGELRTASVSNIVATLKHAGRRHLLVVEVDPQSRRQKVRGVFSRAQIERQIGRSIDLVEIAASFAEIGRALS